MVVVRYRTCHAEVTCDQLDEWMAIRTLGAMPRTVVQRSTELDASAGRVWEAVKTPAAFRLVTRGLIRVGGLASRADPWREGETVSGVLLLFGVLPVSVHHLTVESIDDRRRELLSDEHGGAIRSWRHLIKVTPLAGDRCRYEDRVEIDAGSLTPVVASFARLLYAVRQRRWRELARAIGPVA
jgi:hypothetical protein